MTTPPVPLMRVGQNLLASLQGDLDDEAVQNLEKSVAAEIVATGAKGVLLDVSGLTVVDSFIARVLGRTVAIVGMLGARAVVVGIRAPMAITLVELGMRLEGVTTALNAQEGLRVLQETEREGDRDDADDGA